jgi:hypothetical protein
MTDRASVRQKADVLFDIYLMMGEARTLEKLHAICTDTGMDRSYSLSTLKAYSQRFSWQQRIQDATERAQAQKSIEHTAVIQEMNDRQSRLGTAAQSLAMGGFRQAANNIAQLTPRDSGYLADVGVKLERLARGEATMRQDVAVQMVAPIVQNIVVLFQSINTITDPDQRLREFGMGADRILEEAMGPLE